MIMKKTNQYKKMMELIKIPSALKEKTRKMLIELTRVEHSKNKTPINNFTIPK